MVFFDNIVHALLKETSSVSNVLAKIESRNTQIIVIKEHELVKQICNIKTLFPFLKVGSKMPNLHVLTPVDTGM